MNEIVVSNSEIAIFHICLLVYNACSYIHHITILYCQYDDVDDSTSSNMSVEQQIFISNICLHKMNIHKVAYI